VKKRVRKTAKKFPQQIWITHEDADDSDGGWFQVHVDGINDVDKHSTPVAVYTLVSTGVASVTREYLEVEGSGEEG
jgi:hypothetical protein